MDTDFLQEHQAETDIEPAEGNAQDAYIKHSRPSALPYPQNLIAAIKGVESSKILEDINLDQKKGLAVSLSMLTEQEEAMVVLRYKRLATLREIGENYELSGERARQIIKKALRKMRHPSRFRLIEKGLEAYIADRVTREVAQQTEHQLFEEYMRGYNDGVADVVTGKADDISQQLKRVLRLPIDELDLSVRSCNVLRRAEVNNIGDILKFETEEAILRIRNLGRKSAGEIAKKLNDYGVCNDAWLAFLEYAPSDY